MDPLLIERLLQTWVRVVLRFTCAGAARYPELGAFAAAVLVDISVVCDRPYSPIQTIVRIRKSFGDFAVAIHGVRGGDRIDAMTHDEALRICTFFDRYLAQTMGTGMVSNRAGWPTLAETQAWYDDAANAILNLAAMAGLAESPAEA